ncbi:hypothetical protein F511_28304 [Dorcoceras hygrometricum]|uniref:Splicing factor 3B subunit 1-like n=1 Tax=Dorcoceras hygrometricum TaxID=472368 RepID=A0A2Z7BPA5_9LAMI|nr:hypothetical protein F511_28304 [Dorcoceras hygrometricum]
MALSLIASALQVNFDSVLTFPEEGMAAMFKALESTDVRGFLECPSVLYEQELDQFFDTAFVRENEVISAVQGKLIGISEEQLAIVFELPMAGLTYMTEVPKYLVYDARNIFSISGEPVKTSCKRREMKYEFCLLNDILAKSVTVKAGSFDAVTHERFLLMMAIHFGLKINWSKIMFDIFKEMVTKTSKQAKGFAVQICVLLKSAPNLTLGEAKFDWAVKIRIRPPELETSICDVKIRRCANTKTFPPLKILTVKTVGTYIAKNKNITGEEGVDEPMAKVANKAVTKRILAPADVESGAKKKRTNMGRPAPAEANLAMVTVAQNVEPISVIPAATPRTQRRRAPKRKLVLQEGSDAEIVDNIIHQSRLDVSAIASYDEEEPLVETEKEEDKEKEKEIEPVAYEGMSLEKKSDSEDTDPLSKVLARTEKPTSDEDSMPIDDLLAQIPEIMMLPSVTAAEPTKIKFGLGIEIKGVKEWDWYKASLPQIAISDKGKAPLVEPDTIKGHPAREIFSLICADIDFVVQLREKVIEEIVSFFHSFSLRRLVVLESVSDIVSKEEQMLAWAETVATGLFLTKI